MTAQQLKNSILQMAVQGKLVPQDPNDEPAYVLLERIKAEKQELIKAGKIKKDKKTSEIFRGASRNLPYAFCEQVGKEIRDISEEVPFDIPDSWEWCRWGELSESIQYGYNAPAKEHGRIKMVRISDIQDNMVLWDTVPYCDIDEENIKTYLLKPNDILFARTGGTVGKSYLVKTVPEETIYAGYLIRTRYSNSLCPEYLKFFMESDLYWIQLRNGTIATAQPNCNGKTLANMLIPIPPLPEQHRIVAKIEELLPFIKKYAQTETQLTALNTSFPETLKKSILQEAVQGRLVPQDPDDEPASVLLERIRAEKQALIKAGKIKKDKHESFIVTRDKIPYEIIDGKERCIADEVPFEIPEGWEWTRCFAVGAIIRGNGIKRTETVEQGYPCIRYGEIYTSYNNSFTKTKSFIPKELYEKCKHIYQGDVVFTLTGENKTDIAKAISYLGETPIAAGGDLAFWTYHAMNPMYLMYFLNSPYAIEKKVQLATGDIIVHISGDKIGSILLPVPPLAEQHRIVTKIEQLLPIINQISK